MILENETMEQLKERLNSSSKYLQSNDMRVIDVHEGYAKVEMVIDEQILNGHGFVHGGALFSLGETGKEKRSDRKTLRLSCRLVSVAVCIQKEHRKGCPRKQGLAVVEDEYFVYAGRATARDFLSDADQFSAGARFDVIDGSGQCDTVASGRKAGSSGSGIGQGEQCAAMDKAMNVQDLFIDGHLHLGIALADLDDLHVVAL